MVHNLPQGAPRPPDVTSMPSIERSGICQGINANGTGAGQGVFSTGITVTGTVTGRNPTATEGPLTRFDTSATQNTNAGIRESTNFFYTPGLNAKFKFKFKCNSNSNCRFWIVMSDSGNFQGADEPLANGNGVAFGFRSTDSNWCVARNTGAANSTFDTTLFGAFDLNMHILTVTFTGATNVVLQLDTTTAPPYTTTIPAVGTAMTFSMTMNNTTAASQTFDLAWIQYRGDK